MNMTIGCPIPGASQPKEQVRLIDAAPILKNIESDIMLLHGKANELGDSADAIWCAKEIVKLQYFAKWLKAISTIDPETMRSTAHWENGDDYYGDDIIWYCSACKNDIVLHGGTPEEYSYRYCPNCGARMVNTDEKHCT